MINKWNQLSLIVTIIMTMSLLGCQSTTRTQAPLPDPQNITLAIEDLAGNPAKLKNGSFEGDHLTIQVLKSAVGDLNQDGLADAAIIILENTGGSGNFRDLCLLLNRDGSLVHVDSATLGDRIEITSLTLNGEIITVRYLDRKPTESFAVKSTVKKKVRYRVQEGKLEKITEL